MLLHNSHIPHQYFLRPCASKPAWIVFGSTPYAFNHLRMVLSHTPYFFPTLTKDSVFKSSIKVESIGLFTFLLCTREHGTHLFPWLSYKSTPQSTQRLLNTLLQSNTLGSDVGTSFPPLWYKACAALETNTIKLSYRLFLLFPSRWCTCSPGFNFLPSIFSATTRCVYTLLLPS